MCYEFSTWHWKARAKELHKAQMKSSSADEQKKAAPSPPDETRRTHPEVKEPEKVPA